MLSIYTYIRTNVHTCIHTCIHTYIHTYVHTYVYTYIYIKYTTIFIHAYGPTYIHTYIYICVYIRACIYIYLDILAIWSLSGLRLLTPRFSSRPRRQSPGGSGTSHSGRPVGASMTTRCLVPHCRHTYICAHMHWCFYVS